MGIRIIGLEKVVGKLKDNVRMEDVGRVVRKHGADMQRKAQKNAPVKTGTLKRSIGLEADDTTATVEATAEYAPYVEFGTRFMRARPYLRPAYNEEKELFKKDMKKLVE